jgi:membrane-associated phospholipid phosphatase
VIALAPGWRAWDLARHAGWLTDPVIVITAACMIATLGVLALLWLRPPGLRCVLSVIGGLVLLLAAHRVTAAWHVDRPFVAGHFRPLFPHPPDTSFPSYTTAYFAAVAGPAWLTWRRAGAVMAVITAEVAFGCVYVGVHYVTDVAAGMAMGAACGGLCWAILGLAPAARLLARADGLVRRLRLRPRLA